MGANKNPKSEKWYAAMHARKGKGTNQFTYAKKLGLSVPPGTMLGKIGTFTGKSHTEECRERISKGRKKFLSENPDKVPYKLNHKSNGRSYPEKYWKEVLDNNKVIYEEQFPVGTYQLDFAFVESKIDLEIDGDQHYLDTRIVEHDKRRNSYLENLGWTVIRIKWSEYKKLLNKEKFVDDLINKIKRV